MDNMVEEKKVKHLILLLKEIIAETLNHANLNIEKCYDGIVGGDCLEGEKTTVISGELTFTEISNKTGIPLFKGDVVRVKSTTSTLTDAYIGVKLN